jgi:hypothetical protein
LVTLNYIEDNSRCNSLTFLILVFGTGWFIKSISILSKMRTFMMRVCPIPLCESILYPLLVVYAVPLCCAFPRTFMWECALCPCERVSCVLAIDVLCPVSS